MLTWLPCNDVPLFHHALYSGISRELNTARRTASMPFTFTTELRQCLHDVMWWHHMLWRYWEIRLRYQTNWHFLLQWGRARHMSGRSCMFEQLLKANFIEQLTQCAGSTNQIHQKYLPSQHVLTVNMRGMLVRCLNVQTPLNVGVQRQWIRKLQTDTLKFKELESYYPSGQIICLLCSCFFDRGNFATPSHIHSPHCIKLLPEAIFELIYEECENIEMIRNIRFVHASLMNAHLKESVTNCSIPGIRCVGTLLTP